MDSVTDGQWHLDKKVPLALIFAIALQTAGMVWGAATLNERVSTLESQMSSSRGNGDRLTRLESKLDAQSETLERIDHRLERIEDRRSR